MQVERSRKNEETNPSGEVDEFFRDSGKRQSNTWVTCPKEGDSSEKSEVIPHKTTDSTESVVKGGLSRFYVGMLPP